MILQKHMKAKKYSKLYIAKPSDQCGGSGIKLVTSMKEIPGYPDFAGGRYDYVVQEYIKNPQIVMKKKFDFRVYVLIQSLNPFNVFIAKENMGRFCVEDYSIPKNKKQRDNIYS